jgi:hypothetical protein
MDPGEQITGTRDEHYNLISVLYHALHGAETAEMYAIDAEAAGDEQLISFFREAQERQMELAERAKGMLGIVEEGAAGAPGMGGTPFEGGVTAGGTTAGMAVGGAVAGGASAAGPAVGPSDVPPDVPPEGGIEPGTISGGIPPEPPATDVPSDIPRDMPPEGRGAPGTAPIEGVPAEEAPLGATDIQEERTTTPGAIPPDDDVAPPDTPGGIPPDIPRDLPGEDPLRRTEVERGGGLPPDEPTVPAEDVPPTTDVPRTPPDTPLSETEVPSGTPPQAPPGDVQRDVGDLPPDRGLDTPPPGETPGEPGRASGQRGAVRPEEEEEKGFLDRAKEKLDEATDKLTGQDREDSERPDRR